MSTMLRRSTLLASVGLVAALGILASCSTLPPALVYYEVNLSGNNEVPPVKTDASGSGSFQINPDHTVAAKVSVTGMQATAAHIHEGAAGTNGPVIIPFTKTADNTFAAPPDAKLTDAQFMSYQAGNLYMNVHSAKYPGGELRAQLTLLKKQ